MRVERCHRFELGHNWEAAFPVQMESDRVEKERELRNKPIRPMHRYMRYQYASGIHTKLSGSFSGFFPSLRPQ